MGKYRIDRINEEMAKELCDIIRGIKDPRVSKHFVSILRAEVTPDLKYAKIFYSVMAAKNEEIDHKELKKGLYSAAGYIRGQLAQRLNLRITPELTFVYDESISYGAKINSILHSPSVKEDIRRFDERAEREAQEALEAAAAEAEEETSADPYTDTEDDYDD